MKTPSSFLLLSSFLIVASMPAFAKEISVTVKGMVCSFCAQGIEKKFKALEEVKAIHVSLEKKIVKLETKDGNDISDAKIGEILSEAGYNIDKIQR
jgi:copper chaperone CopZ